jgi:LacI family transcriptional regulator
MIYFPLEKGETFPDIADFRNIPIVIAGRRGIFPDKPHVYSDNLKGGYLAAKYLLRLGHKRIAFFAGFWDPHCNPGNIRDKAFEDGSGAFSSLDRFRGYLNALDESSIKLDKDLIAICGYDFNAGVKAAEELMARMVTVDAMICPNDLVAAGALHFLTSQGIKVPGDISIIGYDDDSMAVMTNPTLTTIRQQMPEIGKQAVLTVNHMISGEPVHDVVVDVELIIRNSTATSSDIS